MDHKNKANPFEAIPKREFPFRKGYMTPDSLEHLDQIEWGIQQLEEIAGRSRGVMSFQ